MAKLRDYEIAKAAKASAQEIFASEDTRMAAGIGQMAAWLEIALASAKGRTYVKARIREILAVAK